MDTGLGWENAIVLLSKWWKLILFDTKMSYVEHPNLLLATRDFLKINTGPCNKPKRLSWRCLDSMESYLQSYNRGCIFFSDQQWPHHTWNIVLVNTYNFVCFLIARKTIASLALAVKSWEVGLYVVFVYMTKSERLLTRVQNNRRHQRQLPWMPLPVALMP